MKRDNELIQESQNLLANKCTKCQNMLENEVQNKKGYCTKCLSQAQFQKTQAFHSQGSNSEQKREYQMDKFNSQPLIRKQNSELFLASGGQVQNIKKSRFLKSYHSLVLQEDQVESDQSQQERLKIEEQRLKEAVRNDNLKLKIQKKIIVGSGFTFDMTDFFKFKKKQLGVNEPEPTLFEAISGSRIAWIILLYTVCSAALIPGWIMNIKATKLLRQQWRFLMQALMVIPLTLHEKRTIKKQLAQKYTLKYIFNPDNIIKPYISSLASSLWFLFVLTSFEWTYVSHGIVLGSLSNFFLSIGRSLNKNSHDIESGGQVLVVLGMLLVFHDSVSVEKHQVSSDVYAYQNTFFLTRTWWERLGGDMLAIFTSFIMSQFSKYTSDLRNYYPPFLSLLLVNCFNVVNLLLISYFFNGASFDLDPFWGIFSVINDSHFISFMYMAIVLAFGQLISVFLITKMFPDPIIPAIAMTLQPFLACFFIDVATIQSLPGNFSMIGFILIFPGTMLVLMGQCFHQREKTIQQQSDSRVKKLMDEIKLLKQKRKQRQTRIQIRQKSKKLRFTNNPINFSQRSRT